MSVQEALFMFEVSYGSTGDDKLLTEIAGNAGGEKSFDQIAVIVIGIRIEKIVAILKIGRENGKDQELCA